jgi:hypothetical protein
MVDKAAGAGLTLTPIDCARFTAETGCPPDIPVVLRVASPLVGEYESHNSRRRADVDVR